MKREKNLPRKRDSFVFYRSFLSAIERLPRAKQLEIYQSITQYSLDGVVPKLGGVSAIMWELIVPQLDANWRKYQNGCKGGEYGKQGGAPKGNQNARNNPKTTPNDNEKENEKENVNVNPNELASTTTKKTIPSFLEISEYIDQHALRVDPQYFHDYYTSNGWKVGRHAMTDWHAALRIWERNATAETSQKPYIALANDL